MFEYSFLYSRAKCVLMFFVCLLGHIGLADNIEYQIVKDAFYTNKKVTTNERFDEQHVYNIIVPPNHRVDVSITPTSRQTDRQCIASPSAMSYLNGSYIYIDFLDTGIDFSNFNASVRSYKTESKEAIVKVIVSTSCSPVYYETYKVVGNSVVTISKPYEDYYYTLTYDIKITYSCELPDMTCTKLMTDVSDVSSGRDVELMYSIKNNGLAATTNKVDVICWDGEDIINSMTVDALSAGEEFNGKLILESPEVGVHNLKLVIDPENKVSESDEDNNSVCYTLTVHEPSQYFVTFDSNGGGGLMPRQLFDVGIKQNLNKNSFVREGYVFRGWSTKASGEVEYGDEECVVNLSYKNDEIVKLYAVWAPAYTVRFMPNGGSGEMLDQNIPIGIETRLYKNSYINGYKVFKGWSLTKDGSVVYSDEAIMKTITSQQGELVVLYAVWKDWLTVENGVLTSTDLDECKECYIPNTVCAIGNSAFKGNKNIERVVIPETVTNIMVSAFEDCSSLVEVVVPETLKVIGTSAFQNCKSLKKLYLPDGLISLGWWAFLGSGIEEINIPSRVTKIYFAVFRNCKNLKTVFLSEGLREIWDSAFEGCQSLEKVVLPSSLESINNDAFSGCSSLKTVVVLSSWVDIKTEAESDYQGNPLSKPASVYSGTPSSLTTYVTSSWLGPEYRWCERDVTVCEKFSVSFDSNGGDGVAMPSQTVLNHVSIPLNANRFSKVGYEFIGWSTSSNGNVVYTDKQNIKVSQNITLYAKWKANEYTITFNPNGGIVSPSTRIVSSDSTIGTLPTPTRSGYTFDGWYTSLSGGTKISSSMFVTGDVTYYAHWIAIPYTVTFNANGGSGSMSSQTFSNGISQALRANAFTRSGYEFLGWSTSASGSVIYSDKQSISVAKNITLYAKWKVINGAFDLGFGTPSSRLWKQGFFLNNTSNDVSVMKTFLKGEKIYRNSFFCNWGTESLTDDFEVLHEILNANGSVRCSYVESETSTYNPSRGYIRENKEWVAGLGNLPAGSYVYRYTIDVNNDIPESNESNNVFEYSFSVIGEYTVIFNANGGVVSPETCSVVSGETISTLPTPVRENHTFDGWYTAKEGGEKISALTVVTRDVTYYAHWKAITYTVTFNANGGTVSETTRSVVTGSSIGALPTPTRNGYTFEGWYTSSSGGTKISSTTVVTGNVTYYAHWKAITYTVTFNANGGTVSPSTRTVSYGTAVGTLPTPTRNGYTFDGWYTSSSGGTKINATTVVAGNVAYYAHWIRNVEWVIEDGCLKSVTLYENVSVSIPNGVTSIGANVFKNCSSLTSVAIPNSVTNIGGYAFYGCSGLKSVTIPSSVTSIGDSAFYGCSGLKRIYISNISKWCAIKFENGIANPCCYGDAQLYINGLMVTNLIIPNDVISIGAYAFYGCSGLTSVTIPNSVTSIGDSAFYGCSGLKSVTIPSSVTSIGWYAFYGCGGLSDEQGFVIICDVLCSYTGKGGDVTIPDSVTNIGSSAFWNCRSLKSVTIPDSVTSIGDEAFMYCSSLTSVTIGNRVTNIGDCAFYYCDSLTSVTIPNSVTNIGHCAFYDCDSLKSVTIPNSVTSIGNDAFYKCNDALYNRTTISGVILVDGWVVDYEDSLSGELDLTGVRGIGYAAFSNCDSLTSVTIPNSVTSIGGRMFYWCDSLTSVTIPDGVTSIGDHAFDFCRSLKSVTIPDSVTSIGDSAFANCDSLTSVTIPNSVTSIGDYSFKHCDSLTSVKIGNSVTSIEDYAFYWCDSLTSVTIPNSVTNIGDYAFYWCDSLTSVTIPNSVTSIGNYAFDSCSLTSVTIPNSVTSIGDWAFSSCSLTSVTIPDSVTNIGEYAFEGLWSLTNVIFEGNAPAVGLLAFSRVNSTCTVFVKRNSTGWGVTIPGRWQGLKIQYIGTMSDSEITPTPTPTPTPNPSPLPVTCTVTFNANGGSVSPTTRSVVKGSVVGVLPTPTRSGYAFNGWYTAASGGTKVSTSTVVTGNITYYAHWTENAPTPNPAPSPEPSPTPTPNPNPTPTPTPTPTPSPSPSPAPVTCTVSFNANGGSVSPTTRSVVKGSVIGALPTPTRSGYAFNGWYTAASGGTKISELTVVTGNAIYYAQWVETEYVNYELYPNPDVSVTMPTETATVYDGYLYNDGDVVGTIQVKVSKQSRTETLSKATATIQIIGEKKRTIKGEVLVFRNEKGFGYAFAEVLNDGSYVDLEFWGLYGMSGYFNDYVIDGARNLFSSKDKIEKSTAEEILKPYLGAYSMILDGGILSVTIAKKGKVTIKGAIDGNKVSAKAQALIGEDMICIPVIYSKKSVNLAFTIWLPINGGDVEIIGLDDAIIGKAGTLKNGAKFVIDGDIGDFIETEDPRTLELLPDNETITVSKSKWLVADGIKPAKVAYKKGEFTITEGKKGTGIVNPSGLKLSYKSKDGSFTGSFTAYAIVKGKLKKHKATVEGILIGDVGYGTITIKKVGTWGVTIE